MLTQYTDFFYKIVHDLYNSYFNINYVPIETYSLPLKKLIIFNRFNRLILIFPY